MNRLLRAAVLALVAGPISGLLLSQIIGARTPLARGAWITALVLFQIALYAGLFAMVKP